MNSIEKANERKFGLDLVRAIAICLVLLSHFVHKLNPLGFWGVELFFGLSGYLIGHILWRNFSRTNDWSKEHIINFWSRRWWRTLPSYYLFFVVFLALHYFFDGYLSLHWRLTRFLWFGQDLFNKSNGQFYEASWSLCTEEWFYLTFPVILLFFVRSGFKDKAFITSIFVVFIISISVRQLLIHEGIKGDLRMVTLARLDAIASGVLIAYLNSITSLSSAHKRIFLVFGLFLILSPAVSLIFYNVAYESIIGNSFYLLTVPLGSSLLLPYFSSMKHPRGFFTFFYKGVEKISLWSYSIYLSHLPILITTYYVMHPFRSSVYGVLASKLVGLLLTICFSAFLFNFFELPLMQKRPRELVLKSSTSE